MVFGSVWRNSKWPLISLTFYFPQCSAFRILLSSMLLQNYVIFLLWFKPVVFNLFHAATHFATHFNLSTPFPKISSQAYEMQLYLHNRKSQWLRNNVRYHYVELPGRGKREVRHWLNQDSFINWCIWQHHWERPVPYTNQSTAQLNENYNNSQISYRIQISNLQTQHILTSRSYSCVAKRYSTVMIIITLIGYYFCHVILLFSRRRKVVPYTKYKI